MVNALVSSVHASFHSFAFQNDKNTEYRFIIVSVIFSAKISMSVQLADTIVRITVRIPQEVLNVCVRKT